MSSLAPLRPLTFALAALALAPIAACGSSDEASAEDPPELVEPAGVEHAGVEPAGVEPERVGEARPVGPATAELPPDDLSLFQLELSLEDQAEHPFRLEALAGHPVLLTFFYARCDTMCPLILSDVRALEAALPEGDREALRVVVVTIDPDDDAEHLRAVAAERGLPLERWSLVRGSEADVRTLASTVGMAYRRTPDGFAHNAILTVLDARGVVVAQSLGTGQPLEPLVSAIAGVTAPSPR